MSTPNALPVLIDSCTFIFLSKFFDETFDNSGVREELLSESFSSAKYLKMNRASLPPLLKDSVIGKKVKTKNGKLVYENLINLANLAKLVKQEKVILCLSPAVISELNVEKNQAGIPFYLDYCNIVSVDNNDSIKFMGKVDELAETYAKYGAMEKRFCAKFGDYIPENDAYILAQAAVFGMYLVTFDEHFKKIAEICSINEAKGYKLADETDSNAYTTSRPFDIRAFIFAYKDGRLVETDLRKNKINRKIESASI